MSEVPITPEALSAAVAATTTWDVLGGIGGLAAGLSLLILLYLQAQPLVNRWAICRFLHAVNMLDASELVTNEQARRLPLKQRIRRRWREGAMRCYRGLTTKVQRVRVFGLAVAFFAARAQFEGTWAPKDIKFPHPLMAGEREIVLEAAARSKAREKRRRRRTLKRSHRGIRCSGGCGTLFGKRRSDHSFFCDIDDGIEGGWHCPSDLSCSDQPTGEHYCGMCTVERRSEAVTVDVAAL